MAVIGTFTPAPDGGWTGTIQTLTINVKARFVPNDNRENDQAPIFRVFAGKSELGAAWCQRSNANPPREYLSVKLYDPALSEAISAALFESEDGKEAQLVWSRRRAE